jgi:hypothetical protein
MVSPNQILIRPHKKWHGGIHHIRMVSSPILSIGRKADNVALNGRRIYGDGIVNRNATLLARNTAIGIELAAETGGTK